MATTMKTFKYILLTAGIMVTALACHKYEMKPYSEPPAINFIGTNASGSDTDDPKTLRDSKNFGSTLPIPDSTNIDTLNIRVRLLGRLNPGPLNITLKAEQVDDYPLPDLVILNPYVLVDSAYRMTLKVAVNRPPQRHITYKAKMVFDYAASDVQAGVDELQSYEITVEDALTREMTGIDEASWTSIYQPQLGPYSENKARFMAMEFNTTDLSSAMPFGPYPAHIARLKTALDKYNEENPGNPLKDENGNLITFDPA